MTKKAASTTAPPPISEASSGASSTKSVLQLRVMRFPGAYFIHDNVLLRTLDASDKIKWWSNLRPTEDIHDKSRLTRKVFSEIRRQIVEHNQGLLEEAHKTETQQALREGRAPQVINAEDIYQDQMPIPDNARFQFLDYIHVTAAPGIEWLICRHENCERVYRLSEAKKTNFRCPIHKRPLEQLAHLFVHNVCGNLAGIVPDDGPPKCDNLGCGEELRLHLTPSHMIRSRWWCPKCKAKGLPAQSKIKAGKTILGYAREVRKNCRTCREQQKAKAKMAAFLEAEEQGQEYDPDAPEDDPGGWQRMVLVTARTVYKPRTMATVDMPGASEQNLLDYWFGGTVDDQVVRASLGNEFLQKEFDTNPQFREGVRAAKRKELSSKGTGPRVNPPGYVREELRDYAGALLAKPRPLDEIASQAEAVSYLLDECGVRVQMLLDGLAVVSATYGYLIGSSDPAKARLNVFQMYGDNYGVLAQRLETEALLFELDPNRVWRWLVKRGLAQTSMIEQGETPEQALRRNLIAIDDPLAEQILAAVTTMMHSMSHLLIRTSERYTGISRDNLLEILWPRALSFVLYNGSGTDLGMLHTTFEGSMYDWFYGARYDASHCPHDPVCRSDPQMAACHACLYITERNCNVYWNRQLDRRYLIQFNGGSTGYWTPGV